MRDFADKERRAWLQGLRRQRLRRLSRPGRSAGGIAASNPITTTDDPLRARIIEFHLTDGRWIVGLMDE